MKKPSRDRKRGSDSIFGLAQQASGSDTLGSLQYEDRLSPYALAADSGDAPPTPHRTCRPRPRRRVLRGPHQN
jgi:hypothetical protein